MLRAGGDAFEVDAFLATHDIAAHDIWKRGEKKRSGESAHWSGFSLVASHADFSDMDRQIADIIAFIRNTPWLRTLVDHPTVEYAVFDFGVEVPHGTLIPIVYFPPELVMAAGGVGIGLLGSIYRPLETGK